jgi:hypothetical protein
MAIVGVFLWTIIFSLTHVEYLLGVIETDNPKQNFIMGSVVGILFTTLIVIVKDVITYLFRKNPSSNDPISDPITPTTS